MNKFNKWRHDKEFDTKTLLTDINISKNENKSGETGSATEADDPSATKKAIDLKELYDADKETAPEKKTQVYEPKLLTPEDDIYEDVLAQLSWAPTKPKYWFEEFGDYWSCSCGHINRGDSCKNCGLSRDILRSLFILHKPADEPGKLSKKLRKTKALADKEDALHNAREQQAGMASSTDTDNIQPIAKQSDIQTSAPVKPSVSDDLSASGSYRNTPDAAENIIRITDNMTPSPDSRSDEDAGYHQSENDSALSADANYLAAAPASHSFSDTLRKKKKMIIIIISAVILAALLAIGGYFIYKYFAAPAMAYEEGKYTEAIKKYEELGDYKDSRNLIWSCYCSIGDGYFDEGNYAEAIKTYNTALELKESDTLHDKIWKSYCKTADRYLEKKSYEKAISTYNKALELKDSNNVRDKINKAKYGYVKARKSKGGDKFETYLSELMKINYSGVREIYDEYYAWHVTIIANNSETDFSNDMKKINRRDTAYFHTSLSGGEPDETIDLYYEVTWPNGSHQIFDTDNSWKSGAKMTARFQYPMPLFGRQGKLTFKLYDKSTQELLGTDSITFTK